MSEKCHECWMSDGLHSLSCPYPMGSKQTLPKPIEKQRKGVKVAVHALAAEGYDNRAGQRLEIIQGKLHLLHRGEQPTPRYMHNDSIYYDVLCEDHVRPACPNCRYTWYEDSYQNSVDAYFEQSKRDLEQAVNAVKGDHNMRDTYIGDAERKEAIEHLRRAWMAGYLKEEEFIERSEQADKARTMDDLAVTKNRLPDKLDQWAAPRPRLRKVPAVAYAWAFGVFISASICAVPMVFISAITHGTDGNGGEKALITVCMVLGLVLGILCGGMGIESIVDRYHQRKARR
jgi:Domain of unknown function (DUF1707)